MKIKVILLVIALPLFLFLIKENYQNIENENLLSSETEQTNLPVNEEELVFGWISDVHLGEERHAGKLADLGDDVIVEIMPKLINKNADFVVITGDIIDNFHKNHEQVIDYHKKAKSLFDQFPIDKYYVIGNHDVQTNSKKEMMEIYNMENNYYSFIKKGITFIAIDQQFNPDGSSYDENEQHYLQGAIHEDQLNWLKEELNKAPSKVIILTHQPIYSIASEDNSEVYVEMFNGDKFNEIVNNSGKVLAILSGHRQAKENEMRRVFDGINHLIIPSAIFEATRFYHGIVKVNTVSNEVIFDYYMDENHDKLSSEFEEITEKCRGEDEKEDYYKMLELRENNLEEYEKIRVLFEKYKDTDFRNSLLLSKEKKQNLRDFEDYVCYKRYLELKNEFFGTND